MTSNRRRIGSWRPAVVRRAAAVLCVATWAGATAPGWCATTARIEAVAAVGITVSDMDRALAFYTGVLGCRTLSDTEAWGEDVEHLQGLFGLRARVVRLALGNEILELTDYLTAGGRAIPADSRSNDAWFQHVAIVVADMDSAYAWLRAHRVVHASTGPQTLPAWNPGAGGIRAFYFRDPDDHNLEIIWFPAGKGDPRWQQHGPGSMFLGIDHTAIVVRDTEASLRFYRDELGMRVAGHSENWGTEQEHLNNVFGARLRITGLRAGTGPGVELLEYLAPRDGRAYPEESRADDLWSWRTILIAGAVIELASELQDSNRAFVSPGAVTLRDRALGFDQGFRVRDPDGHVLEVVNRWQRPADSGAGRAAQR
jgi:catechol 2,3-dioxygenase-like lactoylglutathione lyase family enzyme